MKRSLTLTGIRPACNARSGFTLIELMIAITIIAMLAGLLLVAVQNALIAGDTAVVTTDIKEIETALEAFKNKYGVYPPSSLVIDEDPSSGTPIATSFPAAAAETANFFATTWPLLTVSPPFDFNGDGDTTDKITLNGSECLVLFLAGPSVTDASGNVGFLGLSSNPTNPFDTSTTAERTRFLEIDSSRVSDIDSDGMPELLDSTGKVQTPFNYLRATIQGGYRPQGPDGFWDTDDDETLRNTSSIVGPLVAYYQSMTPGPVDANNDATNDALLVPVAPSVAWNASSFQIVWPGYDGVFGTGGVVANEDSGRIQPATINVTAAAGGAVTRDAGAEADNITNFISGALGR